VVVRSQLRRAGAVDYQPVQLRQVVASSSPEILSHVGRPVAAIDLEAVAEHRADQLRWDGIQEWVPDLRKMQPRRLGAVVVQDRPLRTEGRPLHVSVR
jgi:hypothetical protein